MTASASKSRTPLDYALDFAARGWCVFPLAGKVPLIPRALGGRGCLDGTTDVPTVTKWYTNAPGAGIGLRCGPESGIFVVDVDSSGTFPRSPACLYWRTKFTPRPPG